MAHFAVKIIAQRIDRTTEFYTSLGFKVIPHKGNHLVVESQSSFPLAVVTVLGGSLYSNANHLAVNRMGPAEFVFDTPDISRIKDILEKAGITFSTPQPDEIALNDPDGNRLRFKRFS